MAAVGLEPGWFHTRCTTYLTISKHSAEQLAVVVLVLPHGSPTQSSSLNSDLKDKWPWARDCQAFP